MKLLNTVDFPTWEIKLIVFPEPRSSSLRSRAPLCGTVCCAQLSPLQPSKISPARPRRAGTALSPDLFLQATWPLCRNGYYISFWQCKLFKGQQCNFFLEQRLKLKTRQAESRVLLCADIQTFSAKDSNKLHDTHSSWKLPGFSN